MKKLIGFMAIWMLTQAGAFAQQTVNPVDTPVRVVKNNAFTFGEKLKYRVHYGFMNAAIIDFEVKPAPSTTVNKKTFHMVAYGRTTSAFDWFMKVRDKYETHVDQVSLLPIAYYKDQLEGNYRDKDYAVFNHKAQVCVHEKGRMKIEKDALDLISAVYYFRTFDFSKATPGQTYPFNIYLDNKMYSLSVKFMGREIVDSDLGKLRCIKLRPQLIVDRVFKDADDMTLWITDDANHIPVRVQSELRIGSLKVDLTEQKGLRSPLALVK